MNFFSQRSLFFSILQKMIKFSAWKWIFTLWGRGEQVQIVSWSGQAGGAPPLSTLSNPSWTLLVMTSNQEGVMLFWYCDCDLFIQLRSDQGSKYYRTIALVTFAKLLCLQWIHGLNHGCTKAFREVNFTVSSHHKTRQAAKELLEKGSSLTVFVLNWTKSQ